MREAGILCGLASIYFCTVWLFHSGYILTQTYTWEVDWDTHALFQIRSIMPHDSTRGLSITIPVELVLELDPVFPSFLFTLYQTRSQTPSQHYDLQCEELNSPVPRSHLALATEKQHLSEVVGGSGCSDSPGETLQLQRWLRCLRAVLCAQLFPSWLEFNFLLCNDYHMAWKMSTLCFFWYDKRVAKSWPQLEPLGH